MSQRSNNRRPWFLLGTVGALSFLATFGFVAARPRGGNLWDFGSFLLSGYAASRGLNPYGDELQATYASEHNVTLTAPNLNPPLSLLVFQPLSKLDPRRTFGVWWVLSLGLYVGCVAWLVCSGPSHKLLRALWGVSVAGLWMNQALGQIYAPLAALVVITYRLLNSRPVIAGVLIGVVAAWKPNFLLWPLFLLLSGQTAIASTALLVFVMASMLPALLLGPDIYREWIAAVARYDAMHVATNVSLSAWLSMLMPRAAVGMVAAVGTVGCAAYLAKRRSSGFFCSDLALVLAIALSPISWVGYTLLLLPVFLRRSWPPLVTLSAALFAFPANVLWQWSSTHPEDVFGPRMVYPLAISLLAAGLLHQDLASDAGNLLTNASSTSPRTRICGHRRRHSLDGV